MIKIICVGKIKEQFLKDAIKEYEKRISKYTKLTIIETEEMNHNNQEITKKKEAENIIKHLNNKDYIITMEIEGKEMTSIELSKKIDELTQKNPNLTFIIGGSYGLDETIKQRSNLKLSFSKLTFPHQLFRVILLEQIYRTFKIQNNETYHK